MPSVRLATLWGLLFITRAAFAQATVTGVVFDSLVTHAPMKGATVVIVELSRYAPTDEHGRFQFDTVPAGKYSMTFLHPSLDSIDISAEVLPITIPRGGTVNARLATPSPAGFVSLVCRAAADTFPAMVLGRVRDPVDSTAVAGAVVSAEWDLILIRADVVQRRTVRATARTSNTGGYVLCGVPNDTRMVVSVTVSGHTTGSLDFLLDGQLLVRHDLMVTRSDSAVATLAGIVRDTRGRPAAQALVFVPGTALRARSDASGRYSLERVPAGTHSVEVRRTGNWPAMVNVDVPGKGVRTVDFTVGPGADAGPSNVLADTADATGFTDRSRAGIGSFLSAATISTQPTASLADLLAGLYPLAAAGRARLSLNLGENAMTKLIKMVVKDGPACTPNYFLNGVPWLATLRGRAQMEIESTVDTKLIRGIEVYEPRAIPPQFDRRNRCGSVVVWVGGSEK